MKLAAKIALCCVIVLSVALGLTGYTLVRGSFQAELEERISFAEAESGRFCTTLGAVAMAQSGAAGTPEKAVQTALSTLSAFQAQPYLVSSKDQVFRNRMEETGLPFSDVPEEGRLYYAVLRGGAAGDEAGYSIVTRQTLCIDGQVFCVTLRQDLGALFAQRDQNLRLFRICVLIAIAGSAAMIVLIVFLVLQPLKRLSRSTKQIAGGLYSRRALVRSHDEFGEFAQDFNHMADALELKIRELADAAQRQKDFTASFAHELKTPLTSVIGYADTLRSRSLPPAQHLRAANYIFTEGKRLEAMSRSLLDLFALENAEPQMKVVPAERLAEAAAQSTQAALEEKQLRLRLQVAKARVLAEPSLITTLLYNLIDNARKASEPGTELLLRGRRENGEYRFTLTDHGRGIPPEALSRITEPFFMVDKSRSRSEGGAGIGLALCQRIAEAHGTELTYQSEVGRGTSVSFSLRLGGSAE